MKQYTKPTQSYLTIGTYVPLISIGDVDYNSQQIITGIKAADKQAEVLVFPELSLTGYTLEDLFHQNDLDKSVQSGLRKVIKATSKSNVVTIVGAPLTWRGKLYNCAVIIKDGDVHGVVPKTYLPNAGEFYEKRWFASGKGIKNQTINILGQDIPFGIELLFRFGNSMFGVELCEDIWAPIPPSTQLALAGADVIFNLSASNELVGKSDYRRQMVIAHSAKLACGYVYVSSGVTESTADVVMGGDSFVAETGRIIANGKKFSRKPELLVADIDLDHIKHDRRQNMTIECSYDDMQIADLGERTFGASDLMRKVNPEPFIPKNKHMMSETIDEIFNIQAHGLATRMQKSGIDKLVIGLSGGLDSTLAALVAAKSLNLLGLPMSNLYSIAMPGAASSSRTQNNAKKLASLLGTTYEQIPINGLTSTMLTALKHTNEQDVTYENTQARARTSILLNKANQLRALVVGTGDLSEIALGWCTFNGDHISHYNVNASIPKTLVKHMVKWVSRQAEFSSAKEVLQDIVNTPISPELVNQKTDKISQKTENIIGPYALHDFFLYYFRRWGDDEAKIAYLASRAFKGTYSSTEIQKWLEVFMERFYINQWKRNIMPDGPKVGTVSLSPRGDFRMSPDAKRANNLDKDL